MLEDCIFGFPGLSCLSECFPTHVDPNDLVRQSSGGSILTHSCSWKEDVQLMFWKRKEGEQQNEDYRLRTAT